MKLINLILFCFVAFSEIGCAQTYREDTEFISIFYGYGDGAEIVYIGVDSIELDSLCYAKIGNPRKITNIREAYSYAVDQSALQYLSQYIVKNCSQDDTTKEVSMFAIELHTKDAVQRCTYRRREKIKEYFQGMIEWINKSPDKGEFKKLQQQLQGYLNIYR